MGIIERATHRLEELRRAGVEVGGGDRAAGRAPQRSTPAAVPAWWARRAESADAGDAAVEADAPAGDGSPEAADAPLPSARRELTLARERSQRVSLDLEFMAKQNFLVPGLNRPQLADEFRGVKRALLRALRDAPAVGASRTNLVMVTSTAPGEGRSFCAMNLALSVAAEVDHSALLVDADVLNPSLLALTGLRGERLGLLDLLTQPDLTVPEVLLATNVPKLSLLPCGTPNTHATELLSCLAMQRLLDDLSERYADRLVVFDAPPLLATTEAVQLASRVGQVLVVVAEDSTPLPDVRRAFAELQECPSVFTLINRSTAAPKVPRYHDRDA